MSGRSGASATHGGRRPRSWSSCRARPRCGRARSSRRRRRAWPRGGARDRRRSSRARRYSSPWRRCCDARIVAADRARPASRARDRARPRRRRAPAPAPPHASGTGRASRAAARIGAVGGQQAALDLEPRGLGLGVADQAAREVALQLLELVAIDGAVELEPRQARRTHRSQQRPDHDDERHRRDQRQRQRQQHQASPSPQELGDALALGLARAARARPGSGRRRRRIEHACRARPAASSAGGPNHRA